MGRPVPLVLFALAIFYLWVYVRRTGLERVQIEAERRTKEEFAAKIKPQRSVYGFFAGGTFTSFGCCVST